MKNVLRIFIILVGSSNLLLKRTKKKIFEIFFICALLSSKARDTCNTYLSIYSQLRERESERESFGSRVNTSVELLIFSLLGPQPSSSPFSSLLVGSQLLPVSPRNHPATSSRHRISTKGPSKLGLDRARTGLFGYRISDAILCYELGWKFAGREPDTPVNGCPVQPKSNEVYSH